MRRKKNLLWIIMFLSFSAFSQSEKNSTELIRVRRDNKSGFINKTGDVVIELKFDDLKNFSEGLSAAKKDGEWGFINENGNFVIKPQFNEVKSFKNGLAPVKIKDVWGFIDKAGNIVIKPRFIRADNFYDGLAGVIEKNGQDYWRGYIDNKGKRAFPSGYNDREHFNEGFAFVKPKQSDKWTVINSKGTIITDLKFDYPSLFNDGIAIVRVNGKYGAIDTTGKYIIEPKFYNLFNFKDGIAVASINDKYGFINKKGKFIINPVFEDAAQFNEGLARVTLEVTYESKFANTEDEVMIPDYVENRPKSGFIDKTGKIIIEPKYDMAIDFHEGLAAVSIYGAWGYINKKGEVVIEPRYYLASFFKNGVAHVKIDGDWHIINKQGEIIF